MEPILIRRNKQHRNTTLKKKVLKNIIELIKQLLPFQDSENIDQNTTAHRQAKQIVT